MYPQVTSVYVPVKTPDAKAGAWLFSLLVHGLIIGLVAYFNHQAPPLPMETSIITPEQLADIESQIRANQQNKAAMSGDMAGAQSTITESVTTFDHKTTSTYRPHDAHTARIMQDLAAKETAWQKEQAQFNKQLDQQMTAENQQLIEEINTKQAQIREQLQDFKDAEDTQDTDRQQRIEELEEVEQALNARRAQIHSAAPARKIDLAKDGESTAGSGKSEATRGGNGYPQKGGSTGSNTADYIKQIERIIESHWSPPSNSQNQTLKVSFNLSTTGQISNVSVSGGDEVLKRGLEQALQSSNPLPPPPEDIYDKVARNTITFKVD